MNEKRQNIAMVMAVGMFAGLLLYVGAYLALVDAEPPQRGIGQGPWRKRAAYRVGDPAAQYVFYPAKLADRRLRQRHWEWHDGDRLEK
jgi:hypothetical protein